MLRLKRNDKVIVIAGRSKGTIGSVLQVLGEDRLLVSGVNMVHKHVKPNPQKGVKGGIEKENHQYMFLMLLFIMSRRKSQIMLAIKH